MAKKTNGQSFVRKFFASPVNKYFFITALIFGLLFTFLTPPFCVHDEETHFYRAYQVSQGQLFAEKLEEGTGGQIPKSVFNIAVRYRANYFYHEEGISWGRFQHDLTIPLEADNTMPVRFENTALYPPVAYLPQAGAMLIMRQFDISPLYIMYVSRLATFLCWLALACLALYFMPSKKLLMAMLLLLPMSLFVAGSMSADAVSNSLTALTVAYIFHLFAAPGVLKRRQTLALVVMGLGLALSKEPYFLAILLAVALPQTKFTSGRDQLLKKALIVGLPMAVAVAWSAYSGHNFASYRYTIDIDPTLQAKDVLHHPLHFGKALAGTYLTNYGNPLPSQFVGVLGSNFSLLPTWISYTAIVLLTWCAAAPGKIIAAVTRRTRLYAAAISFLAIAAVSFLLYATWSPFHADRIEGLQGRYYLPAAIILVPAFINLNLLKVRQKIMTRSSFAIMAFLLLAAMISHVQYNYQTFKWWG